MEEKIIKILKKYYRNYLSNINNIWIDDFAAIAKEIKLEIDREYELIANGEVVDIFNLPLNNNQVIDISIKIKKPADI